MTQKTDTSLSVADMSRPGAYLRSIRENKTFPRDYLRSQLGLTDTLFNALEADDHRRLPDQVFVRGYLRRYAELLGVRVAPVLAGYQLFLEEKGLVDLPPEEPVERPLMAMIGSAVALLLATSLVFGAMIVEPEDAVVSEVAAQQVSAEAVSEEVDSSASAEGRLAMAFSTDSWVEVVDARDHILAVNLQREGTILELEGQPPFVVTLGYGPGVAISYRGDRIAFESDPETFAANVTVGK